MSLRILDHKHTFCRSGLAALSDLQTPEWKEIYDYLEKEQAEFLKHESKFRSSEYKWPRDPLHTWSRVWEYPYVYFLLKMHYGIQNAKNHTIVADFGSGVTFFPFTVARQGYHVITLDVDSICENDMNKAINHISVVPGVLEFKLCSEYRIPLADKSCDAVYSISVIEHLTDIQDTVAEISRIIKPKGLLILTVDISLNGIYELSLMNYEMLISVLENHFNFIVPWRFVHPLNFLTSDNSLFPTYKKVSNIERMFLWGKKQVKRVVSIKESPRFKLACLGIVCIKT
jgi:2-polyprenyl-3-methyl-5-hydroxy-6-metoxy-1,4-benzoquinol methylase